MLLTMEDSNTSIEKVAISINADYIRPLYVPVRQYMEFLMQQGLIDKQLGSFYLEGYETARFSHEPLNQDQYMDIMKHLAAILQHMGYNLKNGNNNNNKNHQACTGSESIISLGHKSNNSDHSVRIKPSSSRKLKRRLSSHPQEDDNISTHTWNSRSTHNSRKNTINNISPRIDPMHTNSRDHPVTTIENDEDDYSAYDEDEVRNDIYELLMKDRASSQHQI